MGRLKCGFADPDAAYSYRFPGLNPCGPVIQVALIGHLFTSRVLRGNGPARVESHIISTDDLFE